MAQNLKDLRAPNMKNENNKLQTHKNKNGYEFGKAWRNRWVLNWRLKVSVGTLRMLFGNDFQTAEAA